jgi:DNA-directed RNA polymerase specialized sigma24 family protein
MQRIELPEDIIERVNAGDKAAHELLYSYIVMAVNVMYRDRAGMLPLAHEVYIRLVDDTFKRASIDSVKSFIWGVIRYTRTGRFSKGVRRGALNRSHVIDIEKNGLLGAHYKHEDYLQYEENKKLALEIISEMTPIHRGILLLTMEGLDQQQIQERLGLDETQFRLGKWRAKAKATKLFKERIENGKKPRYARVGDDDGYRNVFQDYAVSGRVS